MAVNTPWFSEEDYVTLSNALHYVLSERLHSGKIYTESFFESAEKLHRTLFEYLNALDDLKNVQQKR